MSYKVDKDLCIACGMCTSIEPEVFQFDDDGYAHVIKQPENGEDITANEALEGCPVDAIKND